MSLWGQVGHRVGGEHHVVAELPPARMVNIAVDHWTASDGQLDLVELLDEAFAALVPR